MLFEPEHVGLGGGRRVRAAPSRSFLDCASVPLPPGVGCGLEEEVGKEVGSDENLSQWQEIELSLFLSGC